MDNHDHDPLGPRLAESAGIILTDGPKVVLLLLALGLAWLLILSAL